MDWKSSLYLCRGYTNFSQMLVPCSVVNYHLWFFSVYKYFGSILNEFEIKLIKISTLKEQDRGTGVAVEKVCR